MVLRILKVSALAIAIGLAAQFAAGAVDDDCFKEGARRLGGGACAPEQTSNPEPDGDHRGSGQEDQNKEWQPPVEGGPEGGGMRDAGTR